MHNKPKKQTDSLSVLQQEINSLGKANAAKNKRAKIKMKLLEEQENHYDQQSDDKLPPIGGKKAGTKVCRDKKNQKSNLLTRIQQFENRIQELEIQKQNERKKKQTMMEQMMEIRDNNKHKVDSFNNFPMYPPIMPYPPYQHPIMPINNNSYASGQNTPVKVIPPFQFPKHQSQHTNSQNHIQIQPQLQKNIKLPSTKTKRKTKNKFRIVGYVVYFSIMFKKFAASFTIHRFNYFKEQWPESDSIQNDYQSLKEFFFEKISLNFFKKPQIRNLGDILICPSEKQEKQKLKKQKEKQRRLKSKKQTSDSDDSDDDSSSSSDSSQSNKQEEKDYNTTQFLVKVDVAMGFVLDLLKEICKVILNQDFEIDHPILQLFLTRQFQADGLHSQQELGFLNQHPTKGYSQHDRLTSQYFIIKGIFLHIFVEMELLLSLCQKGHGNLNQKTNQHVPNGRLYFSIFVRNVIFRRVIQEYLVKKIKNMKTSPEPRQELCPFVEKEKQLTNLTSKNMQIEKNGNKIDEESIEEISVMQVKKSQREVKNSLDEVCEKIYLKLIQNRKIQYQEFTNQTLSSPWRQQPSLFFYLHTVQQIKQEKGQKKKSHRLPATFSSIEESLEKKGSLKTESEINSNARKGKSVPKKKK